jgi:hypothetical protein
MGNIKVDGKLEERPMEFIVFQSFQSITGVIE